MLSNNLTNKKTSLSFYTELIKNIYVFLANNYFDHGNAFKGKEQKKRALGARSEPVVCCEL